MPHPDKEKIVALVNRWLNRSGLTIDQVVARMQAGGCDISRSSFENHFTTRLERKPNPPPAWVLALITAFTDRLAPCERCTAAEALELARLARLPLDYLAALKTLFPPAEFVAAYYQVAPALGLAPAEAVRLARVNRSPTTFPCPYRGLQPFDEAHAEFFFGRETEVEWLLTILQRSRFLAVIGPSGSGKSSVVRAGLLPVLRRQGRRLIHLIQPGAYPLAALAAPLAGCTGRSLPDLVTELQRDQRGLGDLAIEMLLHWPDQAEWVLVVDQFEELFTLCRDENDRRAFIAHILRASEPPDSRVVVILTMRADFYSQAAMVPELARRIAGHQALISPLTGIALLQAITQPAQKVGLCFEPGLVERLRQDMAAEPGVLPLLQHTLLELWERRQGPQLTLAAYQAIGGVPGALAQRADTLFSSLSPIRQSLMRRVMLRLTRLGEGTADTRRRAALAELITGPDEASDVRLIVTQLADARLVTTSANLETGEEIIDVAHEALVRGWPALQAWLAADREDLRLHQQLAEAAAIWVDHRRDESYLYRGARLAVAEEWAATHPNTMNEVERDFLAASIAGREREALARERQRRRIVLVLAAGLAITLALALLAFLAWRQVEMERQATLSRQLAAQGRDHLNDRLDLALLLSLAAVQTADTVEARDSLLTALQTSPHLNTFLRGHTDWVWSVAFSPLEGGRTLASGSADGTIRWWDTTTGQPLGPPLTEHQGWVRCVAFSPAGRTLASAGRNDGAVILWDVDPLSWQTQACQIARRNLTLAEWERYLGDEPYRVVCPEAPPPDPERELVSSTPTPIPTPVHPGIRSKAVAVIEEEFNSDQGFIQTSSNVKIENGQVRWSYQRNGGAQYVYRNIPPFSGNVRLMARGQVDSWTNNCYVGVGIGDKPGSGLNIGFGWIGGGCDTGGPFVAGRGVILDNKEEVACNYTGHWLWIEPATPYTATLTAADGAATLSVEGVGRSTGQVDYTGPYTTLWVGNKGDGDWPECAGVIDSLVVEPLK